MKLDFKLYANGKAEYNSTIFDFIHGDKETKQTKSEKQWQSLVEKIKPFAATWKKEYDAGYDDGIQWKVKIIIDDLNFRSRGSNYFPDDFEQFRKIIGELTGINDF